MNSTTKTRPADRQLRAYQHAGDYTVMPKSLDGNDWWVTKKDGTTYTVDLTAKTCTCPDHVNRKVACKHLALAQFTADAEAPQQERLPVEAPAPKQEVHTAPRTFSAEERAALISLWD